jgi:hypothetical protein
MFVTESVANKTSNSKTIFIIRLRPDYLCKWGVRRERRMFISGRYILVIY